MKFVLFIAALWVAAALVYIRLISRAFDIWEGRSKPNLERDPVGLSDPTDDLHAQLEELIASGEAPPMADEPGSSPSPLPTRVDGEATAGGSTTPERTASIFRPLSMVTNEGDLPE